MATQGSIYDRALLGSRMFFVLLFGINMAGCALGMVSEPIYRTLNNPSHSYETAFRSAVRAMNEVGKITSSDRDAGYVNGTSNLGVDITATFTKLESGGVALDVKGKLPGDKWIAGSSPEEEIDNFLNKYKKYSSR